MDSAPAQIHGRRQLIPAHSWHYCCTTWLLPLASFTLELDVELTGRVTALFGPSGSGKTSLLDVVAGLRPAASGMVRLNSEVLSDSAQGVHVPAHRRRLGYVPQDLALFPHLSVRGNLLFGRQSGQQGAIKPKEILDLLDLGGMEERRVESLSGGERQRVALGRALLTEPRLLLLDEPLASLDAPLKARVLPYLMRIRDELRIPMLYVTHDRLETLSLADEILILVRGQMLQQGAVHAVFNRPASLAVAGLLAVETVQPGRIESRAEDLVQVRVGPTLLTAAEAGLSAGVTDVHVCIRAEDVILTKGADVRSSPRNHLVGLVEAVTRDGALMRVDMDCGFPLTALLTRQACAELELQTGDRATALIKAPRGGLNCALN